MPHGITRSPTGLGRSLTRNAGAAAFLLTLLVALHAPSGTHHGTAEFAVVLSSVRRAETGDDAVARMHGDAKLLLAHTIMAQGARHDLAKAGSR